MVPYHTAQYTKKVNRICIFFHSVVNTNLDSIIRTTKGIICTCRNSYNWVYMVESWCLPIVEGHSVVYKNHLVHVKIPQVKVFSVGLTKSHVKLAILSLNTIVFGLFKSHFCGHHS